MYRQSKHRGVRHQREVNPICNECNSYTDRSVIQTGQLYRQVSYTDKLSTGTYVTSGKWILYVMSATVIQTGQLYRQVSYTDKLSRGAYVTSGKWILHAVSAKVIVTGQLYRVYRQAQHRGVRHLREVNPIRSECNSYADVKLYRQVSYTNKPSTGAYVTSGKWILYVMSATVIQTSQLYRQAQHRGVRHQREVNPMCNECNSYTDRSALCTVFNNLYTYNLSH